MLFRSQAAERGLAQLEALDRIDAVQAQVDAFRAQQGRYPESLADVGRSLGRAGIPVDPSGTPLAYNADTHTVSLADASPLAPLPPTMFRR